MTATPPIPQLDTTGFATVYLTLPAGKFLDEWKEANQRLADVDGAVQPRPEVLFLLGQASLAARLQLRDFRGLIKRVYPSATSNAIVANTVFSTPYVVVRRTASAGSRDTGIFRFITHMRARRILYRDDPVLAESLIVDGLREITEIDGADVTIDAGIGWADFILSGTVEVEKFDYFLRWLVRFNSMTVPIGAGGYAFKRTLTLIGYPWMSQKSQPAPIIGGFKSPSKALIFMRARRGRLETVKKAIKETFNPVEVGFVDGKLDVVALCSEPTREFFKKHQEFVLAAKNNSIERLETHLMFQGDNEPAKGDPPPPDCHCERLAEKIDAFVESEALASLPIGTATAIRNVAFLSATSARDSSSCCDARAAIVAIWRSLRRIVNRIRRQQFDAHQLPAAEKHRLFLQRHVVKNLERIDLWLPSADRVLRQRTVGSFEEFLGQSDRSLSYGGGVQKALLVADGLMNDFYAKFHGGKRQFRFASVFDSVDHIMSLVRTGIVRIPVTKAFHLPGALPDLWHEVGCYEFFRVLPAARFSKPVTADWYRALADHFGDLVSLVYGFDLDFHRFAVALVHGWHEWKTHDETRLKGQEERRESPESKEMSFSVLLRRLVVALEFHIQREVPDLASDPALLRARAFVWLERFASSYLGTRTPPRHPKRGPRAISVLKVRERDLAILREWFRADDLQRARARRRELPMVLNVEQNPAPLVRFDVNTDMNAVFRELYLAIEKSRDPETLIAKNMFASLAAYSRSAAIEYYRRMATANPAAIRSSI